MVFSWELGWPVASNDFTHTHGVLVGTADVTWTLFLFMCLRASPHDLSVIIAGPFTWLRSHRPRQKLLVLTAASLLPYSIGQSGHKPGRFKGK